MKKILITGGSGYLGRNLALTLKQNYEVYLGSRNLIQNQCATEITGCSCYPLDITDSNMTMERVSRIQPDIIIHAGAAKFVEIAEIYPDIARGINIQGSKNVARAAIANDVKMVLGISSDKAASPNRNVYGSTKRQMEKDFCSLDGQGNTIFSIIRLGNIAWSSGSVLIKWKYRRENKLPIQVRGKNHRRFMMDEHQAIQVISDALLQPEEIRGKVFGVSLPVVPVQSLVEVWLENFGGSWEVQNPGAGESENEWLINREEWVYKSEVEINNSSYFLLDINKCQGIKMAEEYLGTDNGRMADKGEIERLILRRSKE